MPLRWISLLTSFVLGAMLGTALGTRFAGPTTPGLSAASLPPEPAAAIPEAKSATPPSRQTAAEPGHPGASVAASSPREWLERWSEAGAPGDEADVAFGKLAAWAQEDPRAALEFVTNAPRFPGRLDAMALPLVGLARIDFDGTIAWIHGHLTIDERAEIGPNIARDIGATDAALALEFAFAPDVPVDRGVFGPLIGELARTDPKKALLYFSRLSEEGRSEAATSFVSQWFGTDPEAALRWCVEQREEIHGQSALRSLVTAAARSSPAEFASVLAHLPLSPEQFSALGVNTRFLSTDAALTLLPHLTGAEHEETLGYIVDAEIQRDPVSVLKLVRESLPPDQAREAVVNAWESWQRSDAKAAVAWAESLDDPTLRLALLGEPVDPLLATNPAQFLARAASTAPTARNSKHIEQAIITICDGDPAGAAAWVDRMPDTISPGIIREVAREWLQRDEAAAWRWVASLPAGTARDTALTGAIQHWMRRRDLPQMTAALAAIADPRRQASMRWTIVQRMHLTDPDRARTWLQAQPISGEVRESWLAILEADN